MRKNSWVLLGLIAIGLLAAEAAAAQSDSPQTPRQQRAPGVPMTPNAGEVQKLEPRSDRVEARREREQLARDRSGPPEPNRKIPMPKPVPSIIAPTR
ncbi:conserved exported hypothetical protein [Bosea sp. 62]|nr:conserved exported hypothetical protein [Bosea sp. 21B]CAD5289646.1 conserved exported hypothetical protein [Bosea sp. 46]CAD5301100.1 conserved exported hypothetical protein [Bosea sp. 7B]VVT60479.1 conserved exported hypothetical protein [Bosea sp. EC-HK365B]VXB01871.1 conserved exported hypothetical protein [Bosea sp. 62]VXB63183.1 conserved exported hypothetical protein [Bosea sp. 127]VXC62097.1 conserved exported hypothetical protein [Bosea sp. 29B]VXC94433.1 conserved exported hypot